MYKSLNFKSSSWTSLRVHVVKGRWLLPSKVILQKNISFIWIHIYSTANPIQRLQSSQNVFEVIWVKLCSHMCKFLLWIVGGIKKHPGGWFLNQKTPKTTTTAHFPSTVIFYVVHCKKKRGLHTFGCSSKQI